MEVPEELTLAIDLAAKAVARRGPDAAFAREMGVLLAKTAEKLGQTAAARTMKTNVAEYMVEQIGGTETLTEYRLSGKANAFRCPKRLYNTIASALARASKPLSVAELMSAAETEMGERPAEFQLRVPLRFWTTTEPYLVTRQRARYQAADSVKFIAAANYLWSSLRKK